MRLLSVVLALFILSAFAVERPVTARDEVVSLMSQIEWTDELRAEFCAKLDKTDPLLFPYRCREEGSTKKILDTFTAKFGQLPKADDLHPVILVPGLGGSGLEAYLNKDTTPAWYCWSQWSTWYQLWIAIYEVILQPCLLDNMIVNYTSSNNSYSNRYGVETRPMDFGGLSGIDKLDHVDDLFGLTDYYEETILALEAVGYEERVNLFGAPFDWRLPVDFLYEYVWNNGSVFKTLVETAYASAGNKPVYIVTHSMGGPTVLYFLNRETLAWKDQYIGGFIPIAGPWSGSGKALRATVSGDNFGVEVLGFSFFDRPSIAQLARNYGGVIYLIPDPLFFTNSTVFVQTPSKNYTANDFDDLYDDIGAPDTKLIHQRTESLITNMIHPEVPTYCLYGYNKPTEFYYIYPNDFDGNPSNIDQPEILANNYGDGTVPLESLLECKTWVSVGDPINCREYDLRDHLGILADDELIADVISIVSTSTPPVWGCAAEQTPVYEAYKLGKDPLKA